MPAGITETDGMMYTGATPWHRLGVKLDNPATAAEAISAAGLDWQVEMRPVYQELPRGIQPFVEILDKRAVVRIDTNEAFTVMGSSYEPVQNVDAFKFFDEVIAQGEAVYHTAGSLFGGKRIWILAKLPDDIQVIPNDPIQPYILLSNSHDGSQALKMQITPIRVVCSNTLSASMGAADKNRMFSAKHTRNVLSKVSTARDALDLSKQYFEMFASTVDRLVNTTWNSARTQQYLQEVYGFKHDVSYMKQDHRVRSAFEATEELLFHETNLVGGMEGTAWAAYNAVTYYIDHMKPVRGGVATEKRLHGSWFGGGADIRQTAWEVATRSHGFLL
jgi:phage/plasmid-like protein (TIGR03299 family)